MSTTTIIIINNLPDHIGTHAAQSVKGIRTRKAVYHNGAFDQQVKLQTSTADRKYHKQKTNTGCHI